MIRKLEIKPDPQGVERAIEELAADYEHPEQVRQFYQGRPDLLQGVRALALEDQVVAALVEGAQVSDKPIALDELLASQNQNQLG